MATMSYLLAAHHIPDTVAGQQQKLVPLSQLERLHIWRWHDLLRSGVEERGKVGRWHNLLRGRGGRTRSALALGFL
jgi:hypothetical protein